MTEWEEITAALAIRYAKAEIDETPDSVVVSSSNPEPKDLASSPRGIYGKAVALGWTVTLDASVTRHKDVLMAEDGKEKRKGDVKTPAHNEEHLWLTAVDSTHKLGFLAEWLDGKPVGFLVQDPVGVPVENFVDYWRLKESVKPTGHYNDGTDRIVNRHYFNKITPFTDWLTDWLELLAPESAPKRKAPKKPKDELLLEGGDWDG
jgi:hypothetical protein